MVPPLGAWPSAPPGSLCGRLLRGPAQPKTSTSLQGLLGYGVPQSAPVSLAAGGCFAALPGNIPQLLSLHSPEGYLCGQTWPTPAMLLTLPQSPLRLLCWGMQLAPFPLWVRRSLLAPGPISQQCFLPVPLHSCLLCHSLIGPSLSLSQPCAWPLIFQPASLPGSAHLCF